MKESAYKELFLTFIDQIDSLGEGISFLCDVADNADYNRGYINVISELSKCIVSKCHAFETMIE